MDPRLPSPFSFVPSPQSHMPPQLVLQTPGLQPAQGFALQTNMQQQVMQQQQQQQPLQQQQLPVQQQQQPVQQQPAQPSTSKQNRCGPAVQPGFDMSDPVQLAATANPPQVPRWATQQGGYHAYRDKHSRTACLQGDYLIIINDGFICFKFSNKLK